MCSLFLLSPSLTPIGRELISDEEQSPCHGRLGAARFTRWHISCEEYASSPDLVSSPETRGGSYGFDLPDRSDLAPVRRVADLGLQSQMGLRTERGSERPGLRPPAPAPVQRRPLVGLRATPDPVSASHPS